MRSGQLGRITQSGMFAGGMPPVTSLLLDSTIYALRITTPRDFNVTATNTVLNAWDGSLVLPNTGRTSFTPDVANGQFIATRNVAAVLFWVSVISEWQTSTDITVLVTVGNGAPFESAFQSTQAGRGPGRPMTAVFSGPTSNLNNPGGVIEIGQKVSIALRANTPETIPIARASFVIQTLDGI